MPTVPDLARLAKSTVAFAAMLLLASPAPGAESKPDELADLVTKLQHTSVPVRQAAAEKIGAMGPAASGATDALILSLGDTDVLVRAHSAWALGKIEVRSETVVNALLEKLKVDHEDWTVRHNTALSLTWIGAPAEPGLRELLGSTAGWARAYACKALLDMGPKAEKAAVIAPALVDLLGDPDAGVKAFAANLAGESGAPGEAVIDRLAGLLSDESANVRTSVVRALGQCGAPARRHARAILPVLVGDAEQWARIESANALRLLGCSDPETIAALIQALDDGKDRVGAYAVQALAGAGAAAVPALRQAIETGSKKARMGAIDALAYMGSSAGAEARMVIDPLLQLLASDPSWEVRFRAASTLGFLGVNEPRVLAGLDKALTDENETVRLNAKEAIARLSGDLPASVSQRT